MTDKHQRYEAGLTARGIKRVHPQYRTPEDRLRILAFAEALRLGELTDEDRMLWLCTARGRLEHVATHGLDRGLTTQQAIDELIAMDREELNDG